MTYLRHNHEERLEQQCELEAVPEPEETAGNVGQQPTRKNEECLHELLSGDYLQYGADIP